MSSFAHPDIAEPGREADRVHLVFHGSCADCLENTIVFSTRPAAEAWRDRHNREHGLGPEDDRAAVVLSRHVHHS